MMLEIADPRHFVAPPSSIILLEGGGEVAQIEEGGTSWESWIVHASQLLTVTCVDRADIKS